MNRIERIPQEDGSVLQRVYNDNGMLVSEGGMLDRQPHGIVRHWHANGVLASEMPLNRGRIDGVVRYWNDKGELLDEFELKDGNGVFRVWSPDGVLYGEITEVNGRWTGRQLTYFDDGATAIETFWLNNQKVSKKR